MCYYVQRVSDHTEHRLAPISEASVLLQEYRCLFSMHFRRPMPIIEQKYQECCAICFKIPVESARYYAIIIKKERISIKYKRNFRLFSRQRVKDPVSYTHLDVYKRQGRLSAGSEFAERNNGEWRSIDGRDKKEAGGWRRYLICREEIPV